MDIYNLIVYTIDSMHHGSFSSLDKCREMILSIIDDKVYVDSAKFFVELSKLDNGYPEKIYEWRNGVFIEERIY